MSRRCSSDDMLKFHPEALCEEWMEKAPLFYSILMSSALSGRRKDVTWLPSVALAGSQETVSSQSLCIFKSKLN